MSSELTVMAIIDVSSVTDSLTRGTGEVCTVLVLLVGWRNTLLTIVDASIKDVLRTTLERTGVSTTLELTNVSTALELTDGCTALELTDVSTALELTGVSTALELTDVSRALELTRVSDGC